MHFLNARKNDSIKKSKQMLDKERGEKITDEPESTGKTPAVDTSDLDALKEENSRIQEEVKRLTNLVESVPQKDSTKLLHGGEDGNIREKLEEKERELLATREELILAKSVPASPEARILDGRNELDNEVDKMNLMMEGEVTKNFLTEEMKKSAQVQEELWLMDLELGELKREKMQLGALLRKKELNMEHQLRDALQKSEERFKKELSMREVEIRKSFEDELSEAKKNAEMKSKEAEEYALACETLNKKLAEKQGKEGKKGSNQPDLMEETENEKIKHQQAYDYLLKEVAELRSERQWFRDSKMATIRSLSTELERLRRHIHNENLTRCRYIFV